MTTELKAPASTATEGASLALETQQPQQKTKRQQKRQERASNRAQQPKKRKKHASTRFAEAAPKYSFANGIAHIMLALPASVCGGS